MQMNLTQSQDDFVYLDCKYPALVGGFGSGKTQGGIAASIMDLARYAPGQFCGYYMPTYDLLKRRAMPALKEECNRLGLQYEEHKSDKIITVDHIGSFVFRSFDRPESIIAYETSHAVVDEIDTISKDDAQDVWRRINERNRGYTTHPAGNTVRAVSTPDQGYSGFMYSRWGKDPDDKYHEVKAWTEHNVFLPDVEAYCEQIKENYDELMTQCYLYGEYVSWSKNKVYHCYVAERHHTDRVLLDSDKRIFISIDFNVGACCATVSIEEAGKTHIVDEFMSNDTRDFCNKMHKDYVSPGRKIIIYPDASGRAESTNASASDLDIIRQEGFRVDAANRNPFIKDRVNSVNGGFAHDRLLVNTTKCQYLVDALESQGYDKRGKPEKFDDHPAVDDWNDSIGYMYHRRHPVNKPAIVTNIRMRH